VAHPFSYFKGDGESFHETQNFRRYFPTSLGFVEIVCISWIFFMAAAFYKIVLFKIGIDYLGYFFENQLSLAQFALTGNIGSYIFFTLVTVTLFPLGVYIWVKVWSGVIFFFCKLYGRSELEKSQVDSVVEMGVTSHLFLLVPIIGPTISFFMSYFILGVGMASKLQFSVIQILMVLISPLLLMGFFSGALLILLMSFLL
jgi:hypothetical protein